jgi:BASS family bile acid:Na+ symporter
MGIQNSGLGLILIFNLFDGLGGMAIITAWWGIWHIVSGLALSAVLEQARPAQVPALPRLQAPLISSFSP